MPGGTLRSQLNDINSKIQWLLDNQPDVLLTNTDQLDEIKNRLRWLQNKQPSKTFVVRSVNNNRLASKLAAINRKLEELGV